MTPLLAELRKTVTLPAAWAGIGVTLLGSLAVTILNAIGTRAAVAADHPPSRAFMSPFEHAFAAMPLGTVGAAVLGVVTISSEYTANSPDAGGGRQITSTLMAVPHRLRLLLAKAAAVVILVVATTAVTLPVTIGVARALLGEAVPETVTLGEAGRRCLAGALYWTFTALLAFAVTVLTRHGIAPLICFILNSSLVSVSLLLTKLTPLAFWLPDLAGRRLFAGLSTVDGGLTAGPGALVMAGWTLALLAAAAVVFRLRDA
jgi:hypothetical protein